jgi:hypothetical protein
MLPFLDDIFHRLSYNQFSNCRLPPIQFNPAYLVRLLRGSLLRLWTAEKHRSPKATFYSLKLIFNWEIDNGNIDNLQNRVG